MPLLWFIHMFRRPRSWLCHVALVLGVAAYVLARINSETYINLIQVDRSQEIQEQLDRQEVARQAATQARKNEVAQKPATKIGFLPYWSPSAPTTGFMRNSVRDPRVAHRAT